jgi:hypothetical protein
MSLPLSNSTGLGLLSETTESSTTLILGGTAVGISSLSILILAAKYVSKKFAPGPDGKRPSISSVLRGLCSSAKQQASNVLNDVKEDVEQAVKKEVSAIMKDPKSLLTMAKNPENLVNSVKDGLATSIKSAVSKNVPASESPVLLKMVDKVLPGQVSDAPMHSKAEAALPIAPSTENGVSIQIDSENLKAI